MSYLHDLLGLNIGLLRLSNQKMQKAIEGRADEDAALMEYQIQVNNNAIQEYEAEMQDHHEVFDDVPVVYERSVKMLQELLDSYPDQPTGEDVKRKAIVQHLVEILNP